MNEIEMELEIDRTHWLRAGYDGNGKITTHSTLRNDAGHMCCLGFFAKKCGYTDQNILNVNYPYQLFTRGMLSFNKIFNKLIQGSKTTIGGYIASNIGAELAITNDKKDLNEKSREAELTRLFKTIGVNVKFIN